MGFMRERLQDALEDQKAVVFDRKNGVLLTWNGSQTFQVFNFDGDCLAIWTTDFESAGTFGGVNADDTKRAIDKMHGFVENPYIEEIEYQDGESVTVKRHYLAVYANDYETYKAYGGE